MRAAVVGALLVATAALYGTALDYAPIYLAHDEVLNALNGHAIATTGHDPNGRFLPLFIYITGEYWATPIVTYLTALLLAVLPMCEISVRLASVIVGVAGVLLTYEVARRLFRRQSLALIAAGTLALTPAHFIHARLAVDHLYPVPFVLGWLWFLLRFLERGKHRDLFAGAAVLGIGAYTYLASLMLMPLYAVVTLAALWMSGHRRVAPYALCLAGIALPLSLLVPWYFAHPTHFTNQVNMYSVYDADRLSPLQGLREILSYPSLSARVAVFYDGFNPSMLFFSGGASLINATGRAGVFLFPFAAFLAVGLYRAATTQFDVRTFVLLAGFLTAPLGPAVVNEMMINRMLVLLPFAVLLALYGVEYFLGAGGVRRALGIALLALMPLQFAMFYRDYMGDYRLRTAVWFERNIRGLSEQILAFDGQQRVPAVYLTTRESAWIHYQWQFYLLKAGRTDLLDRTVYFSPESLDLSTLPAGALIVAAPDGAVQRQVTRSGLFDQRFTIAEPTGEPSFVVYARGTS
jgi:4-amino-4-deoxy-L-arabinose transferase-like glycosyltransferase